MESKKQKENWGMRRRETHTEKKDEKWKEEGK